MSLMDCALRAAAAECDQLKTERDAALARCKELEALLREWCAEYDEAASLEATGYGGGQYVKARKLLLAKGRGGEEA